MGSLNYKTAARNGAQNYICYSLTASETSTVLSGLLFIPSIMQIESNLGWPSYLEMENLINPPALVSTYRSLFCEGPSKSLICKPPSHFFFQHNHNLKLRPQCIHGTAYPQHISRTGFTSSALHWPCMFTSSWKSSSRRASAKVHLTQGKSS